eukprot:2515610-Lingulodinium_polyedra.AAC.1
MSGPRAATACSSSTLSPEARVALQDRGCECNLHAQQHKQHDTLFKPSLGLSRGTRVAVRQ